jgi:hypothetical protein
MAQYQIFAQCVECDGIHKMPIIVMLEDGPGQLQTIADVYKGKVLPEALRHLNCTPVRCWETSRSFIQENNEKIILVPAQGVPSAK